MGHKASIEEDYNTSDLLIFGYIRIMERVLSFYHKIKIVLPTDITKLCLKFYVTTPLEIYLLTNVTNRGFKKTKYSNGIKCIDFNGSKIVRFSIYDINNSKKITTTSEIWESVKAGFYIAKSINLPQFISDNYHFTLTSIFCDDPQKKNKKKKYRKKKNKKLDNYYKFNVLFKIGGTFVNYQNDIDTCLGIIYDNSQLDWLRMDVNTHSNINALQLSLPDLPIQSTSTAVYSYKYNKLISILDNATDIYQLPFNKDLNQNDWKWSVLYSQSQSIWNQPSLCFVGDNDEKLLICGGNEVQYNAVNIYDFGQNKWINLHNTTYDRCGCGIYYDKMISNSNVYIGGGLFSNDCGTKIVEKYDLNKNIWTCLPPTRYEHNYFPAIWIDENVSKDILFIAGFRPNDIGFIELYDLRSNSKWMNAQKQLQNNIKNAIPTNAVIERLWC